MSVNLLPLYHKESGTLLRTPDLPSRGPLRPPMLHPTQGDPKGRKSAAMPPPGTTRGAVLQVGPLSHCVCVGGRGVGPDKTARLVPPPGGGCDTIKLEHRLTCDVYRNKTYLRSSRSGVEACSLS